MLNGSDPSPDKINKPSASLAGLKEGCLLWFFGFLCFMFSKIFEALCIWWFKRNGWTIPKPLSRELKKYVIIVVPHTSNWDFPVGVAARKLMGLKTRYVAKKELFKWPIGGTLIGLGGFPVDRSKNTSFVDQVVALFDQHDEFAITVAPEGTRGRVEKWKTGFYHMALQAGVPIVTVGFDYQKKTVEVGEPYMPTGDIDLDFEVFHAFFRNITPRYPENAQYFNSKGSE